MKLSGVTLFLILLSLFLITSEGRKLQSSPQPVINDPSGPMNKTIEENHRYLLQSGGCWQCWEDEHGPPPK
ncbi:hypothetical protein HanXRQr2_Chr11g0468231 [Helianthus annuus]|uniref:Uncharacterized protein n=1 Tax=Helianthus annuus TaxID=4232 RepID=A0A251T6E4_HELAN|nr:hypothetical protein HanXRQr2_Chr11g0468231 [Helianthus annuus]